MGLFSKKDADGGMLNVIRCDQPNDYLIWKWSPNGIPSRRENAIRWGSSLRVKAGEVAVFVYHQNDGREMDFFEGPMDTTLKTTNFPVLSNLIGKAYGGDTPFQAEVYFINLAGNINVQFYAPAFDVSDPRFLDYAVPVTVSGRILMNISDYKSFIGLHRMAQFEMEDFITEVRSTILQTVRSVVSNIPTDMQIPVLQINRRIDDVSTAISERLTTALRDHFGVNMKRLDIEEIELDKESEGYQDLYEATTAQTSIRVKARTEDEVERLQMAREIDLKRQHLSAETEHFATHRLNLQADVSKTAAESLGELGGGGIGGGGGDGMNPAGMMAGMMLGGAVGGNMANMMNGMMGPLQGQMAPPPMQTPPPMPSVQLFVAANGQQTGPFAQDVVQQMILDGRIQRDTMVWKQGMPAWEMAANVADLTTMFNAVPPKL